MIEIKKKNTKFTEYYSTGTLGKYSNLLGRLNKYSKHE